MGNLSWSSSLLRIFLSFPFLLWFSERIRSFQKPKLLLSSNSCCQLSFRTLFWGGTHLEVKKNSTWRNSWSNFVKAQVSFFLLSMSVGDDYLYDRWPKQCSFVVAKQFILQMYVFGRFVFFLVESICSFFVLFFGFLFYCFFCFFYLFVGTKSLLVMSPLDSASSF